MRLLTTEELRARKPDRKTFIGLPRNPFSVILDNLTSGFNVGSIFRISDAFLAERLYLCGTTPCPPRPAITKTSIGTDRWVPWEHHASSERLAGDLRGRGIQIVAVELTDKSVAPENAEFRFPLALVLGDEMLGVSPAVVEMADLSVAMPMLGMGNSISVVSAYAIVAYELARRLSFGVNPDQAAEQVRLLRRRRGWTMRDLSARTGVAFSTISDIENGRHKPTPATIRKLLDSLLG